MVRGKPPRVIAEYGCGPGEILIALARAGHRVIGIDRSEEMVARARLRASREPKEIAGRITVIHSAAERPDLPLPVDAVLMANEFVLHILEASELVRMFAAAQELVAPAGA